MKKILLLPLLRMPSGHHQVADTIASYLKKRDETIICKKIDLVSEWNPIVESVVTNTYLKWIHYFPKTYAWAYKQMAHTSNSKRSFKYYKLVFLKKMKSIISEENPDLIVCTHAFTSYLLSKVKMQKQCQPPVLNVYTDFFINDVWGREGIDYHFVPNQTIKHDLIMKNNISESRIFVTGIPISEHFKKGIRKPKANGTKWNVLVSGGSMGLGNIMDLLQFQSIDTHIQYVVLCGTNKKIYEKIKKLGCRNIHPLPYISSKVTMNELYDKADAIITKPGGVTISEALQKRIPIFIHSALPGQEEINLKLLKELKLVHELNEKESLADQVLRFFNDQSVTDEFHDALKTYLDETQAGEPADMYHFMNRLIGSAKEHTCKKDVYYESHRLGKVLNNV